MDMSPSDDSQDAPDGLFFAAIDEDNRRSASDLWDQAVKHLEMSSFYDKALLRPWMLLSPQRQQAQEN
jgi:hypothetical protein